MKEILKFTAVTIVMVGLMMWLTQCYFLTACIAVVCAGIFRLLSRNHSELALFLLSGSTLLVCFGVNGFEFLPAVINVAALALFDKVIDVEAMAAELEKD